MEFTTGLELMADVIDAAELIKGCAKTALRYAGIGLYWAGFAVCFVGLVAVRSGRAARRLYKAYKVVVPSLPVMVEAGYLETSTPDQVLQVAAMAGKVAAKVQYAIQRGLTLAGAGFAAMVRNQHGFVHSVWDVAGVDVVVVEMWRS